MQTGDALQCEFNCILVLATNSESLQFLKDVLRWKMDVCLWYKSVVLLEKTAWDLKSLVNI